MSLALRQLEPFHINIGTLDDLSAHPGVGHSWEGHILEQIIARLPPLATFGYYRTAAGAELDLVVDIGGKRTGYEIKLSSAPKVSKGFWNACEDLGLDQAYIVAPVEESYPLATKVEVIPPRLLPGTVPA